MPINLAQYLTHTADVYDVVADSARPIYGGGDTTNLLAPTPTDCFAYFGDLDLLAQHIQFIHAMESTPTKWYVLLPPEWANVIKPGAKIANILDEDGNPIRQDGYVDTFSVYRHHLYGAQLVIAKLNQ